MIEPVPLEHLDNATVAHHHSMTAGTLQTMIKEFRIGS